jgi:hypothetical protein
MILICVLSLSLFEAFLSRCWSSLSCTLQVKQISGESPLDRVGSLVAVGICVEKRGPT